MTVIPKGYHIRRSVSLALLALLFIILFALPFLHLSNPNILFGLLSLFLVDYPMLYLIVILPPLYGGAISTFISLSFNTMFRHEPLFVDLFKKGDQNVFRVITCLVWKESWDELYRENLESTKK